jgi:hypothetical protein
MAIGEWGPEPRVGGAGGRAVAAGLAGVATVTILNEVGRRVLRAAPRIEILGERAVGRLARRAGYRPRRRQRHLIALAAEVLSDGAWFGLAGLSRRRPLASGAALGALAGALALALPGPLGLGERPTRRTSRTAALTLAWYLAAGLAAGTTARALAPRPPDWTF